MIFVVFITSQRFFFYFQIFKIPAVMVEMIKLHFPKKLEEIRENNKAIPLPFIPTQNSLDFFLS